MAAGHARRPPHVERARLLLPQDLDRGVKDGRLPGWVGGSVLVELFVSDRKWYCL
jgi:hypothetical protein